jgi:multicomponent K+:H+ antiporter subunit F
MSVTILSWSMLIAQLMLAAAMISVVIRMFRGPRAQDRVMALDVLYINAMLLLITFGMRSGVVIYFEAALIIGLLGFVATVALAKFLMRGEVIE